ncbi:hypothetical protein ESA94_21030 [Lacibacter luteus]|uniref:Uncharacterized protein n=1 Tax=Lacibacter luteus TaxID=2508719 RepID=A0A4Q1CD72_9BACT|nr:hypothetical protein [Lacibacter luteus]RXK57538.1 hypothetical protein ESA94_21030 [Lacibacter luteus]
MEKETITRQELYNLVWSFPMTTLSKKYAISDVGLRKICIRMNIPMPQAGHWQKLQFGKRIKQTKLDTNYKGDQEVRLELRNNETKESSYKPSLEKKVQESIEQGLKSLLLVPEKLSSPHKLIAAARESLNNRDRWEHNGLINPENGILDIKVSRRNIARALRFMDTLIKALGTRGHSVEIRNNKTYIIIDEQKIEVKFREKLRKEIIKGDRWDTTNYLPTGLLAFQIDGFTVKEWKDGDIKIEEHLSKIIARLETIAAQMKTRELEWKKEREISAERERVKKEYEQKKEKDLSDFKATLLKAARWHKATNLRNYIDAVEAKAKANNTWNEDSEQWIAWASSKADWYDPFIETDDELLADIDRETLEPIKRVFTFPWQL